MIDKILEGYEHILYVLARITVHTLEIIGISIIIYGSLKILLGYFKSIKNKNYEPQNAVIALGRCLGLALEFKVGAEIVNTVIIRELKEQGRTMIIVTHEMEFARHVADRIIFFADGVIEEDATPEDFFNNPKSQKTANFLRHGQE